MAITQHVQLAIANALFLGQSTSFPHTDAYVGLFTADPGFFGSQANEVSGGSYARVQPDWSTGTDSKIPVSEVSFPVATASWGTVTHVALLDSASGGNMLAYEPLSSGKTVDIDDQVVLPSDASKFRVRLTFFSEGSGINTQRTGVAYRRPRFMEVVAHGDTLQAEPGSWAALSWGDDAQAFQEVDTGYVGDGAAPEYRRYEIQWEITNTNPVTLANTNQVAWSVLHGPGTEIQPGWLDSMRTVQLTQDPVGVHAEITNPNSLIWTEWHTKFGQASPAAMDILKLPVGSMTIVM